MMIDEVIYLGQLSNSRWGYLTASIRGQTLFIVLRRPKARSKMSHKSVTAQIYETTHEQTSPKSITILRHGSVCRRSSSL